MPGAWLFHSLEHPKRLKLVFLIGDSPKVGISKRQFQNAVMQSKDLLAPKTASEVVLKIAGPVFSGSVESLALAVSELPNLDPAAKIKWTVDAVSGTAEVPFLQTQLQLLLPQSKVTLMQLAKQEGLKLMVDRLSPYGKVAVLQEADTKFGLAKGHDSLNSEPFKLSRDLLNLRKAYEADQDLMARIFPKSLKADQLALHLGTNTNPSDAVTIYAPDNLAVSQQIGLRHFASYLHRREFASLVIVFSDNVDSLFLARFFQEESPNLRIAVLNSDAMLDREAGAVSLRGVLTLSQQPTGSVSMRQPEFPDGTAFGIYRACQQSLWGNYEPANRVISVVGYDGEWPLDVLGPSALSTEIQAKSNKEIAFSWKRPLFAFTTLILALAFAPTVLWALQRTPYASEWNRIVPFCRPIQPVPAPATLVAIGRLRWLGSSLVNSWDLALCTILKVLASGEELPAPVIASLGERSREPARLFWLWVCFFTGIATIAGPVTFAHHAIFSNRAALVSLEHPAWIARYFYFGNGVSPLLPLTSLLLVFHACAWSRVRSYYLQGYTYRPFPQPLPLSANGQEISQLLNEVERRSCSFFRASWLRILVFLLASGLVVIAYSIFIQDVELDLPARKTTALWTLLFVGVGLLIAHTVTGLLLLWLSLHRLLRRLEFHPIRIGFSDLPDRVSWKSIWSFGGLRPTMISLQMSGDYLSAVDKEDPSQDHTGLINQIDAFMQSFHGGSFFTEKDSAQTLRDLTAKLNIICGNYILSMANTWVSQRVEGWQHSSESSKKEEAKPASTFPLTVSRFGPGQYILIPPAKVDDAKKLASLKTHFIALQYAAFIRYAFLELRNLLGLLVTSTTLLFVAMNVYPFQPIGTLTNFATFLFAITAAVVVSIFYQMDRDPLLSRLSNTSPGKLDSGFGWRLLQFGTLPTITFLATHFPPIGQALVKILQVIPGLAKL